MEDRAQGSQPVRTIDPEEFGMVFEHHCDGIYNLCFRATGDWSLAQDLTATVFLEAWRKRASVRLAVEDARPWLFGAALNVIRNHRRSMRRHRKALARMPAAIDSPDYGDEADRRLDDERRVKLVLRALASLPRWQREVIMLCDWSGMSHPDAALALGIKPATVRSRLSRAHAAVRDIVSDDLLVMEGEA